jgi:hypothetical protein
LRFVGFWKKYSGKLPAELEIDLQLTHHENLGELRQVTVTDLGHEDSTVLLTSNLPIKCPTLVTRCAQRMLVENGISEAIKFFHIDALSSMVGLKVDIAL